MDGFLLSMVERAKAHPQRIALPESDSLDILRLAERIVAMGIGTPVLVGQKGRIWEVADEGDVSTDGFEFFDNTDLNSLEKLAAAYAQGNSRFTQKIVAKKSRDALVCSMFMVAAGLADCVAAGKTCATGDVVFEAMSVIGLAEGVESPSSMGIADIPGFEGSGGSMLGIADCAITAQPTAEELAGIAMASADTVSTLLDWEPRVALLAFSTCGSADHPTIDVVRRAIEIVHERRPELKCDGEFQLDSAIVPAVADRKVPRKSEVAGRANVLVFPNLHAGNIGVKLIQIFGHANAYGPVLQGFAAPVCDFSRSAPLEEMLGNVAMLVVRAAAAKKEAK